MTTRRYQLPEQRRGLADARDRLEAVEFKNAVPTFRAAVARALVDRQTVPSGATPVTVEWDYAERTSVGVFERQPLVSPPTSCVLLLTRGVYLVKAKIVWATDNWNGTAEIVLNGEVCYAPPHGDTKPLWLFHDRATFTHVSSLPTTELGDVFTSLISVYHYDPLNTLISPDEPNDFDVRSTFTVEVRQNSGGDQDLSETDSRLEVYYLGGLGVRSPTQMPNT